MTQTQAKEINLEEVLSELEGKSAEEVLRWALSTFSEGLTVASSLGPEDQVLTHMASRIDPSVTVFFLDTGRMHQETYDLLEASRKAFGIKYDVYFPKTEDVEAMVREAGPNLFYESVEARHRCCHVRKVEPLGRALAGKRAWVTGIRREQSITRVNAQLVEWDDLNGLYKVNPLVEWTADQVWEYIKENDVPYNVLHDQGYPSIGCRPCTRAVKRGDDPRSGRWWWEQPEKRECGLHQR
ncbi:MAG: phosphoadenylyl-sulfate reductase [Promethearchaeota archaeon]